MYVLCTGSERLCSERKFSSHGGGMDNEGILSFGSFIVYVLFV